MPNTKQNKAAVKPILSRVQPATITSKVTGPYVKPVKDDNSDDINENSYYDSKEVFNTYKPDDQLELTEKELREEHTRILTANNPSAPQNIVRYSFKERKFKQIPHIDQTFVHFEVRGNLMYADSEEAKIHMMQVQSSASIKQNNLPKNLVDEYVENGVKKYRLLKNKFNFIDRASQTYNNPLRDKEVSTEPPVKKIFSGLVNQWVIYEAYIEDFEHQEKLKEKNKRFDRLQSAKRKKPVVATHEELKADESARMLVSAKLIERMINQNEFDDIMQDYKYYEDMSDAFKEKEGTLLPLWKFTNDCTRKMCVTSMCWNPQYADLFGISIGSYDYFRKATGLILLYSLKNPSFYEYKIETDSGCMCIDFNKQHPNLIAAGFYDGTVNVYDLKDANGSKAKFKVVSKEHRHKEPVWQVQWQKDDLDGNKNFFSASTDGRIVNWTIINAEMFPADVVCAEGNLDSSVYSDAPIPADMQICAATCFDLNGKQENLIIVGTEDGKILEFSKMHKNKLLTSFEAHHMPIYAIKWNTYNKKIFISCSADWTVKIWDHRYRDPAFTYDLGAAVSDVAWAPYASTVFAAITADGNVVVYDLELDKHDPICVQNILQKRKRKLTHIAFNPTEPIIIVGDEKGSVASLKLSPNLRALPKDSKNNPITILNKYQHELKKIELILSLERDPDQLYVNTTRIPFNYEEKMVKVKRERADEDRDVDDKPKNQD